MGKDARFEISARVIDAETPLGETLLLKVDSLAYFGLDEIGTRFWRAMQDTDEPAEVVRLVAGQTGLDPIDLTVKLDAIMAGMEGAGLLVRKPL